MVPVKIPRTNNIANPQTTLAENIRVSEFRTGSPGAIGKEADAFLRRQSERDVKDFAMRSEVKL
jgi:hypothetical protein